MDPQDPERPSIFSRPERDEEADRPAPRAQSRPIMPPEPYLDPAPRSTEEPSPKMSRGLAIGLGVGGLLILVVGGFVAASVLGPDDGAAVVPSSSASPTLAPSIGATPTTEPSVTGTPSPTPEPTPEGPPQSVAVGGWATVNAEELTVRQAAGANAASDYLLVRGSVLQVAEGPTIADGFTWYRVASLGGAVGWVASGWVAEPFITTLVDDSTLIRCGEVGRSVFDVVDGALVPHDPVAIGDLSLPAAAFDEFTLGAIELQRGVGAEACFTAEAPSGQPTITAQVDVEACGRAVPDGSLFRLRPAAGQQVPPEAQVKDPVVIHPSLLVGGPPEGRMSSNLRVVAGLMAAGTDATGCLHARVYEAAGAPEQESRIETAQCFVVVEHASNYIRIAPAAGGQATRMNTNPGQVPPGQFELNVPLSLAVGANASSEQPASSYVYQTYLDLCP